VQGASLTYTAVQLGNGNQVSAQDTVPFALWCVATTPDDYEDALWHAYSGLGDCDTIGAIVGGIVVLRTGLDAIPATWRAACEAVPGSLVPSGECPCAS
jgi:ADP-ribosylglycohydrolase